MKLSRNAFRRLGDDHEHVRLLIVLVVPIILGVVLLWVWYL
jgi:hypothetical protein